MTLLEELLAELENYCDEHDGHYAISPELQARLKKAAEAGSYTGYAIFDGKGLQTGTTEFEATQLEIYNSKGDAKRGLNFWKGIDQGDWKIKKVAITEAEEEND